MNLDVLTADVIGDVAIVIAASSLLGALARRCGQPAVVGQIVAGILLGPSLLGRLPGHLTSRLFTHAADPYLSVNAQVDIVIFMFTVGYEIDFRPLRGRGRAAPLVAASALLVPLALGMGVAVFGRHVFTSIGETHTGSRSFVLFMGVAVSVTALPVLASIVRERGLAGTTVGTIATAAAGIMDVTAWLVLAVALIGTSEAGSRPWGVTVLLLAGFVLVMLLVVRPALRWWIRRPGALLSNQVPLALVLAVGSAWVTASLGLHPVFGAFLAGLTMPSRDDAPDADVLRVMEQAGGLLLPLYFVVTGLTMNIGALNGEDVAILAVVVACAMLGKLLPAYGAARLSRLDPRQSAMIAALVNTRGLTELIALNVGLTAGIITERLFTILVLMALITTMATGPLISAISRRTGPDPEVTPEPREATAHEDA
ncbi:MAG: cation:proton antiporter [Streptosporangiaceae bacterium]